MGSISAKLLIIIETEIWPNLYYLCKKNNKNIISINARFNKPQGILGFLSKDIYKRTLDKVDHIYCKSEKDMKSFLEYVSEKKVSSVGNIKHALVNEDIHSKR